MKTERMKHYEAPKVEVIEAEIEQGFAASNPTTGTTEEEDMGDGEVEENTEE